MDIAAIRHSYELAGLAEEDLRDSWLAKLEGWLKDAADAELREPNAMVVASADEEGRPSARTVLLRGLDERGLVFYTNLGSRKGTELQGNPHASAVFGWYALQRQVIVQGTIELVAAEEADTYFASRPRGHQLGALSSPQSSVIASREVLEERRAELEAQFPEGTPIPRPEWWGGLRIVPSSVEFWQGRRDRLHDRLRFTREGETWRLDRIAP